MEEVIQLIMQYISIWMPSVTAIFGIISAVIIAMNRVKTAVDEIKQEDTIKRLSSELKDAMRENKAIREQLDILIDEVKKVKNYRENLK
jgi:peptidoglycan hydrolase CwlO-like protein